MSHRRHRVGGEASHQGQEGPAAVLAEGCVVALPELAGAAATAATTATAGRREGRRKGRLGPSAPAAVFSGRGYGQVVGEQLVLRLTDGKLALAVPSRRIDRPVDGRIRKGHAQPYG